MADSSAFRLLVPVEHQEDMRDRMVSSLAHDLRQPMHTLTLVLQALSMVGNEPGIADLVGSARAAHEELCEHVEHLLALNQAGGTSGRQRPILLELGPLISNVVEAGRPLAARYGISVHACPSRVRIVGFEHAIRRVLSNLLTNAIRHSKGTRVVLGVRPAAGGEAVAIEVVDNGSGQPEDVVRSLSAGGGERPFAAGPGYEAGTRLGLYGAAVQAQLAGGELSVLRNRTAGLKFRLSWPGVIEWADAACLPRNSLDSELAVFAGKLVVLVDDQPNVLAATRKLFTQLGAEVLAFREDYQMMEMLVCSRQSPDLLLLDFMLEPRRDITSMLQIARNRLGGKPTLIALLTGHRNHAAVKALSTEIPVLYKPLTGAQLRMLARRLADIQQGDSAAQSMI